MNDTIPATTDNGAPPTSMERRRAADLRTGDLIILGDLLGCDVLHEVRHVEPYTLDDRPRVLLVTRRTDDPYPSVTRLDPDDSIAVAATVPIPDGVFGDPEGAGPNRHTGEDPA